MRTMHRGKSRMLPIVHILACTGFLLVALPAAAQHKEPTEEQCRQMVDAMVRMVKTAPVTTERDKRDARAMTEQVEKIVKDNRARGASECDSWRAIGKLAVRQ